MEKELKAIRGFWDILPEETPTWRFIEEEARRTLEGFGFQEIRIPTLERTELFVRSMGESSDVVQKEMYTFQDKSGQWVTLRPEATASIVRAYVEHRLWTKDPEARLYFIGPMFRYERPQKGRLRQFHQIDAEVLGPDHPMVDAEIIMLLMELLKRLGLKDLRLELNSLGCPGCRIPFKEEVQRFLRQNEDKLCPDCRRRMELNPLRVFDCKVPSCKELLKEAPLLEGFLCETCKSHFEKVKEFLEEIKIPYQVNRFLVRGLDYYTRTVFEVIAPGLGAQNAVAAGGRYDGLVKELGGPDIPGIGFAIGVERLMLLIPRKELDSPVKLFIASLGEEPKKVAFRLGWELKKEGLSAWMEYENKSLKAQLRRADKLSIPFVLIIGEDELKQKKLILRDMKKGTQQEIPLSEAIEKLKEIIPKSS
jgi:histidyl-tRNA synthetase